MKTSYVSLPVDGSSDFWANLSIFLMWPFVSINRGDFSYEFKSEYDLQKLCVYMKMLAWQRWKYLRSFHAALKEQRYFKISKMQKYISQFLFVLCGYPNFVSRV